MNYLFSVLFSLAVVTGFAQNSIVFENPQAISEPNLTTTTRTLQFENDSVRVWKTTIFPNQPLKMHRHEHDRVVVALKGGNLAKLDANGVLMPRIFETGNSYWLDKDPPNELHACVNKSNEPIEVVVIELKRHTKGA